jgi:hypothetical protein
MLLKNSVAMFPYITLSSVSANMPYAPRYFSVKRAVYSGVFEPVEVALKFALRLVHRFLKDVFRTSYFLKHYGSYASGNAAQKLHVFEKQRPCTAQ